MTKLTDAEGALEQQVQDNTAAIAELRAKLEALPPGFDPTPLVQQIDALTKLMGSQPAAPPTAEGIVQALIDQLAKGVTVTTAGAGATPGSSTPVPPTTPDPNGGPLKMTPVANPGDPVTLGVGSQTIVIGMGNNPSGKQSGFDVAINVGTPSQRLVATGLLCTAMTGEAGLGQLFTLNGEFGQNVSVSLIGSGPGLADCFIRQVTVDHLPLYFNGLDNSRSSGPAPNAVTTYNSAWVQLITFGPFNPDVAAPAPALLAPLYQPLTADFDGAGATVNASGHKLIYDKSILLPSAAGLTVKDVVLTGARLPAALGGNGAGVRNSDVGVGFTCSNVEAYGNDNGILTFPADVTLLGCRLHGNGSAVDGVSMTHNAYIGGNKDTTFTAKDYQGSGATRAHDLKIRSGTAVIDGINSTAGGQGRCIDMPDGGNLTVSNGTLTIPAGAADRTVIGFGTESGSNPGRQVSLTNLTLVNATDQPSQIIAGSFTPDAVLTLTGVTYKGIKPNLVGWSQVVGEMTPAV
jgi:hypothetical protein